MTNQPLTEEEYRKSLGIPPNAKVTIIDMGPGEGERKTGGWTDKQISNKSLEEIDQMIKSGELAEENLRKTLEDQRGRVANLRMIRQRKLELGD